MEPILIQAAARKLIGLRIRTSNAENRTMELWKTFRSRIKGLELGPMEGYFSVQDFDPGISLNSFTQDTLFDKWAARPVQHLDEVPEGLETLTLPAGWYAVFTHRGTAASALQAMQYIFTTWLPGSGYRLDQRPHFEIMPEHYRPDDPEAEESFWIPVQL